MKPALLIASTLMSLSAAAQYADYDSPLDGRNLGIVIDHPGMKTVVVRSDVTYLSGAGGDLKLDVYHPPQLEPGEKRPVVVFLNAIGEFQGQRKVKSWGIYQTWPRLVAAHGYVGISMEADQNRVQESLRGVFDFLRTNGGAYHADADKIGVYAASANVGQAAQYLMSETACRGIRAAVFYYGRAPQGPFRKDLPVLFVVAESDVRGDEYNALWGDVLKNKAPWTLLMASGQPHAFDSFSGDETSRKIIRQTLSFWQDHLEPAPAFADPHPLARQILAAQYGNQPEKAVELLKAWTIRYPDDMAGLSNYALYLRYQQRYGEARQAYGKMLALQPKNGDALLRMAVLSYLDNRPQEAESYVARAVAADGESHHLYAHLAYWMLSLRKLNESVRYYQKAIQLGAVGNDYYNLACAHALLNEKEPALTALEHAVRLGYGSKTQFDSDPDLTSVRNEERYRKLFAEPIK